MAGQWRYRNDSNQLTFSEWLSFPETGHGGWVDGTTWVEYEARDTELVAGQYGHARFYEGDDYDVTINLSSPLQIASTGQLPVDVSEENVGRLYSVDSVPPECENNFDCPEGEKCVEGECVPCNDQSATHFQVRFEYEELVTTSDANQVMSTLSSIYPISGSYGQIIQGQETSGLWYYPRIRFCNSDGEARPYTGALAFYGYCNPDGSTALYSNNRNLTEKSWVIGQKSITDSVSANPWSVPRLLIEFIEQSKIVWEVVCSGVDPEEFPPIEPVEPTEPEEPDEPTEPEEPTEPTEPTKPTEPDAPETGCECETYIGEQIARAGNILYDGLILLKREMSVGFREIVVEMYEARKMNYQLSMFVQNQQYQLMQAQHQRLYEIRQILESISSDLKKGLIKDDDGLIDIVKEGLVEGDDGLVDILKDFVDNYEPVTIENEYRTQSHRVIDNLDEVVNKL